MGNLLKNDEEISLIKFISRYQYLSISDAKYFFKSNRYYRDRIRNLVDNNFLRRSKRTLVLDKLGIQYVETFGFEYNKLNKNEKYKERLLRLSSFGAFYHNCEIVKFTPSFDIKDKQVFTTTGRRYIGVLEVNGIDHLTYYITNGHDKKYITSVIYDIQKERYYKNIIVFVDNIENIDVEEFIFGYNSVIIIENNEICKEKLKYLHSIRWKQVIEKYFNGTHLSEYNFCDYSDDKELFINTFYLLDIEKVRSFKYFMRENSEASRRKPYVICPEDIKEKLEELLPGAYFCVIDLEEYTDKVKKWWNT